jgi:tetratricopeptide (TPR) repeat protein
MSLLLDALKDADGRRNKPEAAATQGRAPKPQSDDHVLAILEDAPAGPAPSAAIPRQAAAPGRIEQTAETRTIRRPLVSAAGKQPGTTRRFILLAVLVMTILGIGAGYLFLAGNGDLPELLPASLAAPVAPAIAAALPIETEAVEAARNGHVHLEPGLKPELPLRTEETVGTEEIAPLREPVPQTAVPPEPQPQPRVVAVRSTPVIERSNGALQRAYAAMRAGNLVAAETGYREALRDEPHQIDAHLGLAVMAQARGNAAVAMTHYRAVLESVPDHARAWSGLSDLAGAQELDGMESRLRGLIARRPAATLQFALGNVLARQSRWAEAQELYFRAANTEPDNAEYAFNLAVSLDHLGKRDATVTWYARALELARDGRQVQFDAASAAQRLTVLREASR